MKAFTGLLKKKGDTLEFVNSKDEIKYQAFKKAIPDEMLVETYMEIQKDDGTLAQLAKIHAMIRQLCMHTGDSVEDMKLIVKKRTGLCIEKNIDGSTFLHCKSFGDCSRDELSLVINTIQEISLLLEFPLS